MSAGSRTVPLGDLAKIYSGGTPSRKVAAYWNGNIPWVTTAEIESGKITATRQTITEAGLNSSAARIAPPGTILLAMYGQGKTRGKSAIIEIPAAMNQACAAIEVGKSVNRRYLLHYLGYRYEAIRAMSNSGSQDNLSGKIVKSIPIVVPSLVEQASIAVTLDDAEDSCDSLERAVAKRQAMKQGMMQQLLTGRTRLPGFSETWDSERLGAVLGTIQAGVSVNSVSGPGVHGILKTSCVSAGIFDPSERKTISPADIARARVYPRADSLIISRMNTPSLVGEVGYVGADEPTLFLPDRLWLARGDKSGKVDMRWLGYLLSGDQYREHMREIATGTSDSMKNISRSVLLCIQIPLPEIQEQRAISAAFAEVDREIDALRLSLAKAQAVKRGMMQQLLTGRTRLAVQE